jgi:hypothetical protein
MLRHFLFLFAEQQQTFFFYLQGKSEESLSWDQVGGRQAAEESGREYPLLSIVAGIATAIVLVVLVIVVAMLVRCGGSSPAPGGGSRRGAASWRDKHARGTSSPDLLVQIESGSQLYGTCKIR